MGSDRPREFGVLAQFQTPELLLHACTQVRDEGFSRWDAHTPVPVHGLERAMGLPASKLPFIALATGLDLDIRYDPADTSGTAKAMVGYFNELGVSLSEDQILKMRDPEVQKTQWGIPEQYLAGHGWHTYTLVSEDQTVRFEFTHNVNGRMVYTLGTLDALLFLSAKVKAGVKGEMFTMTDVLKGLGNDE